MSLSAQKDCLPQLVHDAIPDEVWRVPQVERRIADAVRLYRNELVVDGGADEATVVRDAVHAAQLPVIDDAELASTVESLYGTDTVIRRMRRHADQLLAADDPRWDMFRELAQINLSLDRRDLSAADGARLRERRGEIWVTLRQILTDEEFRQAAPYPDVFAENPDLLRQIAADAQRIRSGYGSNPPVPDSPAYAQMRREIGELMRSVAPELRSRLIDIARDRLWQSNREAISLRVRTRLIQALPPAGNTLLQNADDDAGGDPDRPAYWHSVATHYYKQVGDTSPGLE